MRWVLYVDMDAFYVSCELRDHPELRGRPVIVGPDPKLGPSRGVVLSASYEARKFGVRSAMPAAQAGRLCPDATWIRADFEKYGRMSGEVRARLARFDPDVQSYSIDEAAIVEDLPDSAAAEQRAREVQSDLSTSVGLPCSIGVASSRLVAKIATDQAKPAGIRVVPPETTAEFLAPLAVRSIPGVGAKTEERLRAVGVEKIGDLLVISRLKLRGAVGSFAAELHQLAKGEHVDSEHPLEGTHSRSSEETFDRDIDRLDEAEEAVRRLARRLGAALAEERMRYPGVSVAVRWADFSRVQRSHTLRSAREGSGDLESTAVRLLRDLWSHERTGQGRSIRMVSITAERLVPARGRSVPLDVFDAQPPNR